jgi:hypothetical protein
MDMAFNRTLKWLESTVDSTVNTVEGLAKNTVDVAVTAGKGSARTVGALVDGDLGGASRAVYDTGVGVGSGTVKTVVDGAKGGIKATHGALKTSNVAMKEAGELAEDKVRGINDTAGDVVGIVRSLTGSGSSDEPLRNVTLMYLLKQ